MSDVIKCPRCGGSAKPYSIMRDPDTGAKFYMATCGTCRANFKSRYGSSNPGKLPEHKPVPPKKKKDPSKGYFDQAVKGSKKKSAQKRPAKAKTPTRSTPSTSKAKKSSSGASHVRKMKARRPGFTVPVIGHWRRPRSR